MKTYMEQTMVQFNLKLLLPVPDNWNVDFIAFEFQVVDLSCIYFLAYLLAFITIVSKLDKTVSFACA